MSPSSRVLEDRAIVLSSPLDFNPFLMGLPFSASISQVHVFPYPTPPQLSRPHDRTTISKTYQSRRARSSPERSHLTRRLSVHETQPRSPRCAMRGSASRGRRGMQEGEPGWGIVRRSTRFYYGVLGVVPCDRAWGVPGRGVDVSDVS